MTHNIRTVGMYSPYIPEHEGGGERYFLSVAEILSKHASVRVLLRTMDEPAAQIRDRYSRKFNLNLSRVHFQRSVLGTQASFLRKLSETAQFDLLYHLTDGSLFFSLARKNILHLQFPFSQEQGGMVFRLKLLNWPIRNANSLFTKKTVEHAWKMPVQYVHYPYVDSDIFQPKTKEKIIVSVGRFFSGEKSGLHQKQQHILVQAFRRLVEKDVKGWRLVLIGTVDPGDDNLRYAEHVQSLSKGLPVKILHDVSFDTLRKYYSVASIYWHATGFSVDEKTEPLRVEHFGISVLEAMSSGAVPVVVKKGGLPEIVQNEKNGYLWETERELLDKTTKLMNNQQLLQTLASNARDSAALFSRERFENTLMEMVK